MAVRKARLLDPTGRNIQGNLPLGIPSGTETENAALTGSGLVINETKSGLDVLVNNTRITLVPSASKIETETTVNPGDSINASSNSVIPIKPSANGTVADLVLPPAPQVGDTVVFFDPNQLFNGTTGVDITGVVGGFNATHEFRDKGGFYQLEYIGGTIGWVVTSPQGRKPYAFPIAGNQVANVAPVTVQRPGYYSVTATNGSVYYPPVNNDLLNLGDEVFVLYVGTNAADNFTLANAGLSKTVNSDIRKECSAALIHYRKTPFGIVEVNGYYKTPNIATMAEAEALLANNIATLNDVTLFNVELSALAYFDGEDFDGLIPNRCHIDFPKEITLDRGGFTTLSNSNTFKYFVNTMKLRGGKLGTIDMVSTYGGTTPSDYWDVGMDVDVNITDDGTERKFPKISKRLTLNVEKPGCTSTIEGVESTYDAGDVIIIHVNKFLNEADSVYTLKLGTEEFTIDDGTTKFNEVTLTGPGVSVLYKGEDRFWRMRHETKYTPVSLEP